MKVSYNWLTRYIKIGCSIPELAEKLTMAGIEVEGIETLGGIPSGVVVGQIVERNQHPNADHLSCCKVNIGSEFLDIVCGAPNCDAGKKVPVATIGTVLFDAESKTEFKIKQSNLRGEKSHGMLCSARELGLSNDHEGLLELASNAEIGAPVNEIYRGDTVFDLEITPNRPDLLSHWGVARDVACLLKQPAALPEIPKPNPSVVVDGMNLVTVENPKLCPRYMGRVIRGVKVAESPEWLKKCLTAIGLRPINNIVDITNFVLFELGQPLHAFDRDKLAGGRVVIRNAAKGEIITLLDGTELKLNAENLVIADAEKPMCLAGVMGGLNSGVSDTTTSILLETAVFEPWNIRTTARSLGISSDSSYRYERGVDWQMAEVAADRAIQLILEIAGGELVGPLYDVKGELSVPAPISCRFDRIRLLTGMTVTNDEIVDIFRKLRLDVSDITADKCMVQPTTFRLDLEREADLAEEVARVHGLDKIPDIPVTVNSAASFQQDAYAAYQDLREQVIGQGYYECLHYSTVSPKSALSDTRFTDADLVKMINPIGHDSGVMRPSLLGEMLATIERNISRRNVDLGLFELDRVFCANPAIFPEERYELMLVLTGRKHPELYSDGLKAVYDFYDLKGSVESLLATRRIGDYKFEACEDARFVNGMAAALTVGGELIGHLGMLSAELSGDFKTDHPVYVALLDVARILAKTPGLEFYRPLSPYPATSRDIAFVTDSSMTHAKVLDFIKSSRIKNLESVHLFDIYTDEKALGAGRKSMAYSFVFRSKERTLTDNEVNTAYEKLRSQLAEGLGVELR